MKRWLGRAIAAGIVLSALVIALALYGAGGAAQQRRWTFLEAASPEALGFRLPTPEGGAWKVEEDPSASGARALVNHAGAPNAPPAVLVASAVRGRDVRAATRCRVSGASGACGLVFRHLDDGTHHVVRMETSSGRLVHAGAERVLATSDVPATSGRLVLARVHAGAERVLATSDVPATSGWHELGVEARGDRIRVTFDGAPRITTDDVVPAAIGSVGLWAPSEGEASFDDLAIEVLPATPQAIEVLPLLRGRSG